MFFYGYFSKLLSEQFKNAAFTEDELSFEGCAYTVARALSIEIHRGIQLEVNHRPLYIAQSSPQSFF